MRDLCQHIMDLAQNAVTAGASHLSIRLEEDSARDTLVLRVEDDGSGMASDLASRASDPFCTTRQSRRVGLGLSLLQATAQRCAGSFALDSAPGRGTRVECTFRRSHPDLPPLGNPVDTIFVLATVNPGLELRYEHRRGARTFVIDAADLCAAGAAAHPAAWARLRARLTRRWESFRSPPRGEPVGPELGNAARASRGDRVRGEQR